MPFNLLTSQLDEEIIKHRYFDDGKVRVDLIARDIISSMKLITIVDNEEILYYQGGIYLHGGKKKVKEILTKKLGQYLKIYHIREIIAQIQARTYIDRDDINSNPKLIHTMNGIYDIGTSEFMDFDSDIYVTNKIPVIYNPKSKCPKIDKFLSEILDENDRVIIYELIGYCLYRGYPFQKAFVFVADGSNGKSVLINLLKVFIGKTNTSNIPLQALEYDRFASSSLYGKMVNSFSELSDKAMKSTGVFKALTGGDTINAQRKFENSFGFVNYAKLVFSCNQLPSTTDDTDAYFRRWIIINFPNKFEGKDADPNIIDKITTQDEMSGLLNVALAELSKIIDYGGLTHSETTEKTRERYNLMSDSLRAFVVDCIETDADSYIIKDDFFNAYLKYCGKENLPDISKTMVGRSLMKISNAASEDRFTTPIGRKTVWKGIKFKDGCEFGKNQVVDTVDTETESSDPNSLDDYEDDEQLSQHDRMNIIRDIFINNPDGITEKELIIKIDGRMDKGEFRACIRHYKEKGNVVQMGNVYQWYED
ncbi:MAG: DNA primase family protein [Candidatus Thorarchaeota archaeon]